MPLGILASSLVSPLGLDAAEHAFFLQAEVAPHASGAWVDRDGAALAVHDCGWIPATRPWESRLRLLARQALARVGGASKRTPIVLVAPRAAVGGDADLVRFFALDGRRVVTTCSGAAAFVRALHEAEQLTAREEEVIVLAVDSLLEPRELERWCDERYSGFTRPPLPPSEGAAAVRVTRESGDALVGRVRAWASARSAATDDNDAPGDHALARAFAELPLPPRVAVLCGPRDVDLLRHRDIQLAMVRHHDRMDQAETPSLEGRVGRFGSAGGLMALALGHAWLRHGMVPGGKGAEVALAWSRSSDGAVGAALVEDA